MTEQTRAEKEMAITVVTITMWGAILLFVAAALVFFLEIIPTGNGMLIGLVLLAIAGFDYFLMKRVVGKMEAELD